MSHEVHTTHALVLGSAPVQDSDKLLWLLTEDLGLVFASAKSVREETSKLRYALQDLACVRASLVRGRSLWRVTGAEATAQAQLSGTSAETFGRIASLVRRMMPTDESNAEMYALLTSAYTALCDEAQDAARIEQLTVARVLYQLGYLSRTDMYTGIVDSTICDSAVLEASQKVHKKLIHDINQGLAESQL